MLYSMGGMSRSARRRPWMLWAKGSGALSLLLSIQDGCQVTLGNILWALSLHSCQWWINWIHSSANQPSVQTLHRPVQSHRKVPTNTELHRSHRVCTTLYRLISLYRLPKTSRISATLHYQTLIVVLIQTYITPNSTYSSKYIINY